MNKLKAVLENLELIGDELKDLRKTVAECRTVIDDTILDTVDQERVNLAVGFNCKFDEVQPLTYRKTLNAVEDRGFKITGFVLTHADGRRCISDQGAVRWFHDPAAYNRMLHPDSVQVAPNTCPPCTQDCTQGRICPQDNLDDVA